MIVYCYNEPVFSNVGARYGEDRELLNMVVRKTREEILQEYWEYWKSRMESWIENQKEMGRNIDHVEITEDRCIEDWKVVNWAWEEEVEEIKKFEYIIRGKKEKK